MPRSAGLVPLLSCGLGSDGKKVKVHVGVARLPVHCCVCGSIRVE